MGIVREGQNGKVDSVRMKNHYLGGDEGCVGVNKGRYRVLGRMCGVQQGMEKGEVQNDKSGKCEDE